MILNYFLRILGKVIKWVIYIGVGLTIVVAVIGFFVVRGLISPPSDQFGNVVDEAKEAGLTVEDLPGAGEPYFAEMDHGLLVEPAGGNYPEEITEVADILKMEPEAVRQAAIRGQNMWLVWTGGNDRFWEFAALNTIGAFDLLKLISNDPNKGFGRHNRFRYNGMINEPCFEKSEEPDPERYGLRLDRRIDGCGPDPFADAEKYPGAQVGARGDNVEVGSYYGEPTGVLGLRLFPNPDFDAEAEANWDPDRFYNDEEYYNNSDLVRPYRVGMSCAFCHVGPNPLNPPKNVEEPTYAELSSNPGAQYYWVDRIFVWDTEPRPDPATPATQEHRVLYQLFHTNPMGVLDTSLVSTDYMNNPRTMNAVYETLARFKQSAVTGWETLDGGELDNVQFQDFEEGKELAFAFKPDSGRVASMRVLKDGADSVGALGALNRVYLNIGLFSEEWLLHFRPFIGGQLISPIEIENAQNNSVYWRATEEQSIDLAIFFLVTTRADRLEDASGGAELLTADEPLVDRGMEVFAENCAACHSDRAHQPDPDPSFGVDEGICEGGGAGPDYLECWDRYWKWANSDGFKNQMVNLVKQPDFLTGNYLSTERRVPMDLLKVNACSPIATNAVRGDIWDNFSSDTYKNLPAVGEVTVEHPVSGGTSSFQALGNGRGYLRPAALVSLWTSAPYLLNNSVGFERHYYSPDYYAAAEPTPMEAMATEEPATEDTSTETATSEADEGAAPEPTGYVYNPAEDTYSQGYEYPAHVSCPSAHPDDPYMPCTENRVRNFERSIRKMLNPETRNMDAMTESPVPGQIYRLSAPACLMVPKGFAPDIVKNWKGLLNRLAPWAITKDGAVAVGPFPADFPINALVNTELLPDNDDPDTTLLKHGWKLAKAGPTLIKTVKQLGGQCSPEQLADPAIQVHAEDVIKDTGMIDTLVGLSKCPDYVVNKGHYFGADLSAEDKDALIAFLKRM